MCFLILVFFLNYASVIVSSSKLVYPCITPNGEAAYCTSLFSCPPLMQSIGSQENTALNFVKKSICLGCEAGDFMVCCGSHGNYSNLVDKTPQLPTKIMTPVREYDKKRRLLPPHKFCGYQQTDDRFYHSTTTALDEFPWLIHISASKLEDDPKDRCSGVIISNRYVLTDAYCGAKAVLVSVGLYNIRLNISCLEYANVQECTDPTEDIEIESRSRSSEEDNGAYGFMLLRLAKKITFTDYVRPICLPLNGSKRRRNSLTLSGWGPRGGPENIIKKRLSYIITDTKVCCDIDKELDKSVKSANITIVCLSPKENNVDLVCNGERGGPLMYSFRHQWYTEGVVLNVYATNPYGTYSPYSNSCSNKDPISGMKITPKHIQWILDNIDD